MAFDLNTLVHPPFAQNPPVKLNIDAKILGIIIAVLSALAILFGLGGLLAVLGLGALLAPAGAAGWLPLAFIGLVVVLISDVISLMGGWQMYQGNAAGKRLVIYGLAIAFLGEIVYGIGYVSLGGVILPIIVIAIIYYLVVISRVPGEQAVPPTTS